MKSSRSFAVSVSIVVSLFIQNTALAKVEAVLGKVALNDNPNVALPLPQTDESEILLSRSQYLISYNKNRRTPNWVAWKLEASDLGSSGRTNSFSQDADLESYLATSGQHAVTPDEYTGSCFDRGHQIPSADRTDNRQDNESTFMMSNMIPQTAYLNRVIWEHLETYARALVHQGKKLYVIAGPIYDQDFGAIGPKHDIQVPSKDFKIIIVLNQDQTPADINANTQIISVVMPNVREDGSAIEPGRGCQPFVDSKSSMNDWQKYQTSVGEIEKMSGLSFSLQ